MPHIRVWNSNYLRLTLHLLREKWDEEKQQMRITTLVLWISEFYCFRDQITKEATRGRASCLLIVSRDWVHNDMAFMGRQHHGGQGCARVPLHLLASCWDRKRRSAGKQWTGRKWDQALSTPSLEPHLPRGFITIWSNITHLGTKWRYRGFCFLLHSNHNIHISFLCV